MDVLLPARGDRVDRFTVRGEIGRGAMGVVLRAHDEELDRAVALKFVHPGAGKAAARWRQRLRREAQALARIAHPNVVTVHSVGEHRGLTYVAMDLVEGTSLTRWLEKGDRPWRQVVDMFLQVGAGLAAAHAAGLVHRDFKPDNALVDGAGRPRVLDFGLVADRPTASGREVDNHLASETDAFEPNLTHDGAMLGTPRSAAPEQHLNLTVDARADQFSFCLALYEALAGRHPFGNAKTRAGWVLALSEKRAPPRSPSIPPRVHVVLARGLEHRAADRFETMDELLVALRRATHSRRWPVFVAGTAFATIGALLWPGPPPVEPCADEALPGWSALRETVRQRIVEHPVPYAGSVADAVETRADEFAARWQNDSRTLCERERKGELAKEDAALVRRCLDSEGQRFTAVLEQVDAVEVATLARLPAKIPIAAELDACGDVERLRGRTDPEVEQDVAQRLDAELARLSALSALARPDECLSVAAEVRAHAEEVGSRHDAARALQLQGSCSFEAGDYESSLQASSEAYFELTALDDGMRATRSALLCANSLRRLGKDPDSAEEWVNNARVQANRAAPHLLPSIERFAAIVAGQRNDHGRAAEILHAVIDDEGTLPDDRAAAISDLGTTLYRAGEREEALVWMERATAHFAELHGNTHPQTASALMNLATALNDAGRVDEAAKVSEQAVHAMRSAHGTAHPYYAFTVQTRGAIHHRAGELEAAVERYGEACSILTEVQVAEQNRRACVLGAVVTGMSLGDGESVRRWATSAARDDEASLQLRAAIAWALAESGEVARAVESLGRVDDAEESNHWVMLARAAIAAAQGDRASARAAAESIDHDETPPWIRALATRQVAEVLRAEGDEQGARTMVQARRTGLDEPVARAILDQWLARTTAEREDVPLPRRSTEG